MVVAEGDDAATERSGIGFGVRGRSGYPLPYFGMAGIDGDEVGGSASQHHRRGSVSHANQAGIGKHIIRVGGVDKSGKQGIRDAVAWASQCIERNGKFYYYVTLTNNGRNIGVAVADSPEGPFKDALGKPLAGPNWDYIDPTVFIDDGQAYLFWGNPSLYWAKLNEDMTSFNGGITKTDMTQDAFGAGAEGKSLYTEGPWFYKRGDLYYMVYAASGIPETIAYSTSSSPTGPWKYRGIIMGNKEQGGAFTNHPGVIDYKGKSYFFYHNARLPGGGGFSRSVAVEEFEYNADGTFPTITMSNEGPKQLHYLDPYQKTKASVMCFESGVEVEKLETGEVVVAYIENGDYIKIKGADFKNGAKKFIANISSDGAGGKIEIRLDQKNGELAGSCEVPNSS